MLSTIYSVSLQANTAAVEKWRNSVQDWNSILRVHIELPSEEIVLQCVVLCPSWCHFCRLVIERPHKGISRLESSLKNFIWSNFFDEIVLSIGKSMRSLQQGMDMSKGNVLGKTKNSKSWKDIFRPVCKCERLRNCFLKCWWILTSENYSQISSTYSCSRIKKSECVKLDRFAFRLCMISIVTKTTPRVGRRYYENKIFSGLDNSGSLCWNYTRQNPHLTTWYH